MLSRDLEVSLNLAFRDARAKRHEFMTVEHLLLALLDNEVKVLKSCGGDIAILRRDLAQFVDETTPKLGLKDTDRETQPTLGFQRVGQFLY